MAKKILDKMIKIYGSAKNYFETDGGRLMGSSETRNCFDMYVEGLEIENKLELIFKENTVARSCMTDKKDEEGQLVGRFFSAFPISYRVNNIEGVFHHEIGTHYIRKHNNQK